VVAEVKATVKLDDAVAVAVGAAPPSVIGDRSGKVMVWEFETVSAYIAVAPEVAPVIRYDTAAAAAVGGPDKRPVVVLKEIPLFGVGVTVYVSVGFGFVSV
jgi:hypothetical protein